MSDTPNPELDAASQASPGELLRRQREALALSRDEVAEALNLRPAVIDGLEEDVYDEVPIATYRRGYLRSYANLLGLDPDPVLAAYKARVGRDELETKVTPVHVVNKPPSRLGAWLFRLATLLVIAGLAGLTLMWWQSRGGSQPPTPSDNAPVAVDSLDGTTITEGGDEAGTSGDWSSQVDTTGADATAADDAVEAPAAEADSADSTDGAVAAADDAPAAESADSTEQTAPGAAPEAVAASDDAEETAAEPAAEPAADPGVLELTFNEQSWTEIFDATDRRVFVGLQQAGTTATVEGEPPFRLTVGNATGVELTWQGEAVDLSSRTGANNVARFTLGE